MGNSSGLRQSEGGQRRLNTPSKKSKKATIPIDLLEKLKSHVKPEPIDPVKEIQIGKDQKVRFDTALTGKTKIHLVELLKN